MGELVIREDYLLSEAFEVLGRRLYGAEWNGREYEQSKVPSPEELRETREPHECELTEIKTQLAKFDDQISKTILSRDINALNKQKAALEERQNNINLTLFKLPLANDITEAEFRTYDRKQIVEQMIVAAIRDGALEAHNGRGEPIHPLVWSGVHGFRYYFELSMALLPRSASPPRRREHVRITEESFKKWIDTNSPRTPSAEVKLSPEDRCKRWLTQIFNGHLRPHDIRKADLMAKAVQEIHGLRERAFVRAWEAVAPKSFKKGGRRSRAKSTQR